MTGVPAIMIHQLYLIPGTEFFDRRDELGLATLPDHALTASGSGPDAVVREHPRSDFARYIVVRFYKAPRSIHLDMTRGRDPHRTLAH